MKRLVVCCDGTWQNLARPYPTNVVKIAQAILPTDQNGMPQLLFYNEGIGTGVDMNVAEDHDDNRLLNEIDRIRGGAFGIGIDNSIQDAYQFLCLNYEPGDEIYLFGFSRGAYTVRSLAGLIRSAGGLLQRHKIRQTPAVYQLYRDHSLTLKEKERLRTVPRSLPDASTQTNQRYAECWKAAAEIYRDRSRLSLEAAHQNTVLSQQDLAAKEARVDALLQAYQIERVADQESRQPATVTLLGCWDTVGSLGVPNQIPFLSSWINDKYKFHDTLLSSIIENALHAVAIDEIRSVFDVTPMQQKSPKPPHQTLRQVWFPGGHGCVGGGSQEERGLSDAALEWMIDQVKDLGLGLEFDKSRIEYGLHADYKAPFDNEVKGIYALTGEHLRHLMGASEDDQPQIHATVRQRWQHNFPNYNQQYRPENLKDYFEDHPEILQAWSTVEQPLMQA